MSKKYAVQIKVNGDVEMVCVPESEKTVDFLRTFMGGYAELVVPACDKRLVMVINQADELPFNKSASRLYGRRNEKVHGDALILMGGSSPKSDEIRFFSRYAAKQLCQVIFSTLA